MSSVPVKCLPPLGREEAKRNIAQVAMSESYWAKSESELAKSCEDILEVLEKHLIPSAASGESKVSYHKMPVCVSLVSAPPSTRINRFRISLCSCLQTGLETATATLPSQRRATSAMTVLDNSLDAHKKASEVAAVTELPRPTPSAGVARTASRILIII